MDLAEYRFQHRNRLAAPQRVGPESLQRTWDRARQVVQRAKETCYAAQLARGRAQVLAEKRRWLRSPEALMPTLGFMLEPLDAAWMLREYRRFSLDPVSVPRPASRTATACRLYVWGYGFSPGLLPNAQFLATEAARRFAAERGWEPRRPAAWAGERSFPLRLHVALRKMEPVIRADPSVAGWGGQIIHRV